MKVIWFKNMTVENNLITLMGKGSFLILIRMPPTGSGTGTAVSGTSATGAGTCGSVSSTGDPCTCN